MADDKKETSDSPTIKVCVRVRPFIKEELDGERGEGGPLQLCVAMPTTTRVDLLQGDNTRSFEFDRCFWSFSENHPLYATQTTLQDELGATMLDHAMNGFNNCIFAYGQTGSGKSFSVLGGAGEDRGLLPRVVEGLFDHFSLAGPEVTCKTLVSFIEIYNEQIRDLLAPREAVGLKENKLQVKQHPVLGTHIRGLTEAAVDNSQRVLALIDYGTAMRHVSATAMNATSSRSHCIFTFKTSVSSPSGQAKMSQTHLVDLAGSERSKRTKATGDRLKEGASINQSLSTLARVISALASKKKSNPPFRDSKLTYILKESLCGNSKTVMMAAISPSSQDYEETLSTLKFAQSVKQVQTHAVCNQVCEKGLEMQLRSELEKLREQLQQCEAEKSNDARRLSLAQRRLDEQMQLCARFGGDWESLLAAERKRNQHREAITKRLSMDSQAMAVLQAQFQQMYEQAHPGGSSASDSNSSSEWDGSDSSSSAGEPSSTARCSVVLVRLGGSDDDREGDGSSQVENTGLPRGTHRQTSFLAVRGPAAKTLFSKDDASARADALSQSLKRLEAEAAEAEATANALAPPNCPRLRLRAMVAVDTRGATADLVVRSSPAELGSTSPAVSGSATQLSKEEWLSEGDLRARLTWLQETAAARPNVGALSLPGGAWAAAAAAATANSASVATDAEAQALRAELAEVQAQLADAKRRLKAEERLAAEARTKAEELCAAGAVSAGSFQLDALGGLRARGLAAAVAASFTGAITALDAAQASLEGSPDPCGQRKRSHRRMPLG